MMTSFRATICLTLAATALVTALACRPRMTSDGAPDSPEHVAWARLVEADELYPRPTRGTASTLPSRALAARPTVGGKVSEAGAESPAARRPALQELRESRADREPERSRIVIGGGTQKYLERVARWSRVFRREAAALRTGRRDLQFEIETYSLAESRTACRAFGSVLARLDPEFEDGAPSRGLSLRIARMLGHYRHGVSECLAGRPVAAFGYLSEGDRGWATVAKSAARMFEPRPLRARKDWQKSGLSRSR